MGKKKGLIRAVADTNVLVSAILFGGRLEGIRRAWKKGRMRLVVSREIVEEVVRVLAYPKFRLSQEEISRILRSEILPFAEIVDPAPGRESWCRDPDDDKFIRCALAGRCPWLISGDEDLASLGRVERTRIVSPADFLRVLDVDAGSSRHPGR